MSVSFCQMSFKEKESSRKEVSAHVVQCNKARVILRLGHGLSLNCLDYCNLLVSDILKAKLMKSPKE